VRWPWGTRVTEIQAKELAKYCFAISQAALIGSVGYVFIGEGDFVRKLAILLLGLFVATVLLLLGMRLLREVKE